MNYKLVVVNNKYDIVDTNTNQIIKYQIDFNGFEENVRYITTPSNCISPKEYLVEIETENINLRTGKVDGLSWFDENGVVDEYVIKPKLTNGLIKILKIYL